MLELDTSELLPDNNGAHMFRLNKSVSLVIILKSFLLRNKSSNDHKIFHNIYPIYLIENCCDWYKLGSSQNKEKCYKYLLVSTVKYRQDYERSA